MRLLSACLAALAAHEQVTALTAAAPSMARFLAPAELTRLRATIVRLMAALRDTSLRASLGGLAVALSEPASPPAASVEAAPGNAAIAPGDLLGRDVYITADGRRNRGTRLMLRELDVGGHVVRHVVASVAPAHAAPLLGLSFLAKFKSWTLDNRRHVLVIVE